MGFKTSKISFRWTLDRFYVSMSVSEMIVVYWICDNFMEFGKIRLISVLLEQDFLSNLVAWSCFTWVLRN